MSAQFRAAAFAYDNAEDPRFAEDDAFEAVWEAYQEWAGERTDAEFADDCRDFLDSLKTVPGVLRAPINPSNVGTVSVDGWSLFETWQFSNRYKGAKS